MQFLVVLSICFLYKLNKFHINSGVPFALPVMKVKVPHTHVRRVLHHWGKKRNEMNLVSRKCKCQLKKVTWKGSVRGNSVFTGLPAKIILLLSEIGECFVGTLNFRFRRLAEVLPRISKSFVPKWWHHALGPLFFFFFFFFFFFSFLFFLFLFFFSLFFLLRRRANAGNVI